jgi:hypothetical protein
MGENSVGKKMGGKFGGRKIRGTRTDKQSGWPGWPVALGLKKSSTRKKPQTKAEPSAKKTFRLKSSF